METKKNPSKDINRQRGVFFLIGICSTLTLVITAFQWTTLVVPKPGRPPQWEADVVFTNTPITTQPEPVLPKNNPQPKKLPVSVFPVPSTDSDLPELISPEVSYTADSVVFVMHEPEPEAEETIFVAPEQWPTPTDGYESFYKEISKNLKYPRQAVRAQIEGKVFIQFTVRKDGSVGDVKVLKGIGYGCDEEAARVLALPKWNPGKQRGKTVHVKMVVPIFFKMS